MQHGILLHSDSSISTWTAGDPTGPNPCEWPLLPGDVLVDFTGVTEDEALAVIELAQRSSPEEREALLAGYPRVTLPSVLPAEAQHVLCVQPGFRRIVQRPTQDWHDREICARIKSNSRIANGEKINDVIDEEFGHLSKEDKAIRKGMKNDAPFPLTPRVRLVERKIVLQDGSESVETLRQFPFHEPVASF